MTDPTTLGAAELAAAIRDRRITAIAAVDAHIARIEEVNPKLNAMVVRRFDEARAEARAVDSGELRGPLAGVPITVKESLDLSGTPSTFGLTARAGKVAPADERHVARARAAGAIVLGKTNVAQLLLYLESDNPVYGRTNHPDDAARSPGGSSGGEAAMIASRASALGLGTDIGGSVRCPAAFCGIASLKPTAGRCDDLGTGSVPVGQRAIASQVGVLGRSAADVALGYQVIASGEDVYTPPVPPGDPAKVEVAKLKVAYYIDDGTFAPSPAVRRAVREAAAKLGAREWTPPDVAHARDLFFGILAGDGFAGYGRALGKGKRDPRIAKIELAAKHGVVTGLFLGASGRRRLKREVIANYGRAETDHHWQLVEAVLAYRRRFAAALGEYDAILCPAMSLPAWRHGAAEELVLAGGYTCLYNVLGWPAGVVPWTRVRAEEESDRAESKDPMDRTARETERASAGLPIGVQVAARPWREDIVLAVMQALQPRA